MIYIMAFLAVISLCLLGLGFMIYDLLRREYDKRKNH